MPLRLRLLALALLCAPLAACDGGPTSSSDVAILGCGRFTRYAAGATVAGTLSPTDCSSPIDGTLLDVYRLDVPLTRSLAITMRSGDFDAYLYPYDENGSPAAEDDDSDPNSELGSRISLTLQAGTHYVVANTLDGGIGAHTLSSI